MNRQLTNRRGFVFQGGLACAAAMVGGNVSLGDPAPAARDQGSSQSEVDGLTVTCIGESACIPDVGSEAASFVINGKHLVDTGWCGVLAMRRHGLDPLAIESLILTHFHQDHYIGLPQLLFYLGLHRNARSGRPPLKICGPQEYLEDVVKAAFAFLQIPRFPELAVEHTLIPLQGGKSFELGDLRIETFAVRHISGAKAPEPALAYKVTRPAGGASLVYSGDTQYYPPLADFAAGVPLLIHDGAHTAPKDAATIAKTADVGRLMLTHFRRPHAARLLAEARSVFPHTELTEEGSTITVAATQKTPAIAR